MNLIVVKSLHPNFDILFHTKKSFIGIKNYTITGWSPHSTNLLILIYSLPVNFLPFNFFPKIIIYKFIRRQIKRLSLITFDSGQKFSKERAKLKVSRQKFQKNYKKCEKFCLIFFAKSKVSTLSTACIAGN